jgi:hypothetical protein
MLYKPYGGARKELDLLGAIAPVFRIDLRTNQARLIGTGFWATAFGHLVTAGTSLRTTLVATAWIRGRSLQFRRCQT